MLILASTSQSRRDLLTNAGLEFEIAAPGVDDDEVKLSLLARKADASTVATTLAELKAARVSTRHPEAFTIGRQKSVSALRIWSSCEAVVPDDLKPMLNRRCFMSGA